MTRVGSDRGFCRRLRSPLSRPSLPCNGSQSDAACASVSVEPLDHGMNQSFHSPTPFFPLAIPTASFSFSPDPPNFQNRHTLPHSREITELILLKEAKRHAARKELLTHDCVYYLPLTSQLPVQSRRNIQSLDTPHFICPAFHLLTMSALRGTGG